MNNIITETSAKVHFASKNIFHIEATIGDDESALTISITDEEGITLNDMPFSCSCYTYKGWTTRTFAKEHTHLVNWVIKNMEKFADEDDQRFQLCINELCKTLHLINSFLVEA